MVRKVLRALLVMACMWALPACKNSTEPSGCVDNVGPSCPAPPAAALTLLCPSDMRVEDVKTPTQAVTFNPGHTGGVDPVSKFCTPGSGSDFALGTTPVTCNGSDSSIPAKTATCAFSVTLVPFVPPVPDLSVTRFVAFGDSLTRGTFAEDAGRGGCPADPASVSSFLAKPQVVIESLSYPTVLKRLLEDRYVRQDFTVINEGKPTETAADGYLRFLEVLDTHNPEAVLLLQGIVDLHNHPDDPTAPVEALETDVRNARARGVKVFLSTLLPVYDGRFSCTLKNQTIRATNDLIRSIAAREGAFLVDPYAVFAARQEALIGFDGLHLTQEGYEALAAAFFDVIKKNVELPLTMSASSSALASPKIQVRPPADRQPVRVPKRQQ